MFLYGGGGGEGGNHYRYFVFSTCYEIINFTNFMFCETPVKIRVGKMPAFMSKVHAGGIYRYLPAFTGIYRRLLEFTGVY